MALLPCPAGIEEQAAAISYALTTYWLPRGELQSLLTMHVEVCLSSNTHALTTLKLLSGAPRLEWEVPAAAEQC